MHAAPYSSIKDYGLLNEGIALLLPKIDKSHRYESHNILVL